MMKYTAFTSWSGLDFERELLSETVPDTRFFSETIPDTIATIQDL